MVQTIKNMIKVNALKKQETKAEIYTKDYLKSVVQLLSV